MRRRGTGITRTNWMRGLVGVPDVGGYVTKRVGAIIGSQQDSMDVSAGYNMAQIATHWAGFECSIKFLFLEGNQTAGLGSIKWLHATYSISTSAYAGIHLHWMDDGSLVTDAGADSPIVFNWQAIIVSI